jgi:hypothetical protein
MDGAEQRFVYPVELRGKFFGAAPRSKLAHQRFGQHSKTNDIGEQRCAAGTLG